MFQGYVKAWAVSIQIVGIVLLGTASYVAVVAASFIAPNAKRGAAMAMASIITDSPSGCGRHQEAWRVRYEPRSQDNWRELVETYRFGSAASTQ